MSRQTKYYDEIHRIKPQLGADLDALRTILWNMYAENTEHGRHHETQRATTTGIVVSIAAAILGAIKFNESLGVNDLPLTVFLIVLGLVGFGFSQKQYERYRFHRAKYRAYRSALDATFPANPLKFINDNANKDHAGGAEAETEDKTKKESGVTNQNEKKSEAPADARAIPSGSTAFTNGGRE